MSDNSPPALFKDILSHIAATSRQHIKDGGELRGTVFLILDGKMQDVIVGVFEDDKAKDIFAESVRQRASKTQPDAVVLVSEAWSIPDAIMNDPVKMAEHCQHYEYFADAPYRIDIVMMSLETRAGYWAGRAEIKPHKRGRTFGPINWFKPDKASGRFTSFLPIIYATPQQAQAYLDRARAKFEAAGMDPDKPMPSGATLMTILTQSVRQAPINRLTDETLEDFTGGIIAAWRVKESRF